MNATHQTEEQLVHMLQQHLSADFTILYDAYSPALHGVLLRLVNDPDQAEDLLQDAFVKIWSNSHHYDPKQGRLYTWLLTITRNLALDELRNCKVRTSAGVYIQERSEQMSYPGVFEGLALHPLLSQLAPKYQSVIELMYYQGYTYQEAADKLNLPIGTIKTRARMALQHLKVYLSRDIYHYHSCIRF